MELTKVIAPPFFKSHLNIRNPKYTHFWEIGGRGSTKSSFVSIEIVLGIMEDSRSNAVVFRKIKETCRNSVYEQIIWAIKSLGVEEYWQFSEAPNCIMLCTYKPTGQKIFFDGMDKGDKSKGFKVSTGYIKYIWLEELDQFGGMEEIRKALQSFMRSDGNFKVFYTFNPPRSLNNWVNQEVLTQELRENTIVNRTNFTMLPKELQLKWLGENFIAEAKHLKKVNPRAYEHEYLGKPVGTGGNIFNNVTIREIADDEISKMDKFNHGIDFGFTIDPAAYTMNYLHNGKLYFIEEVYQTHLSNDELAEKIKQRMIKQNLNPFTELQIADSSEPKSIADLKRNNLNVEGAKKGKDSIKYGIKFLQSLREIIIDKRRTPNTAKEFLGYEYPINKNGEFVNKYPDENNHILDSVRYSLEYKIRGNAINENLWNRM